MSDDCSYKGTFGFAEEHENKTRTAVEYDISSRLEFLSKSICKVQAQILKRKKLSRRFKRQLRDELSAFERTFEEQNTMWLMGDNLAAEQRRSSLEARISQIRKELRDDNLSRWKDIVWLERELTELAREYYSLFQSARALGS